MRLLKYLFEKPEKPQEITDYRRISKIIIVGYMLLVTIYLVASAPPIIHIYSGFSIGWNWGLVRPWVVHIICIRLVILLFEWLAGKIELPFNKNGSEKEDNNES